MISSHHVYEVRPRKDHRGVDLISDALPFGRLWYGQPNAVGNAIGYAKHRSRSHNAVIRVYDAAGNVIESQFFIGTMRANHGANPKGSKEGRRMNETQTLVLIHTVAWPILILALSKTWKATHDVPSEQLKSTMNRGL